MACILPVVVVVQRRKRHDRAAHQLVRAQVVQSESRQYSARSPLATTGSLRVTDNLTVQSEHDFVIALQRNI